MTCADSNTIHVAPMHIKTHPVWKAFSRFLICWSSIDSKGVCKTYMMLAKSNADSWEAFASDNNMVIKHGT